MQAIVMRRKRRRGKEDDSATSGRKIRSEQTDSDIADAMRTLAEAKTELMQVITSAATQPTVKNDIPAAIQILSKEFTIEPRKLSGEDMQKAIDCLSNPDNATIFINLSKELEMKEHRDRWLEKTTQIDIFGENCRFGVE